MEYFLALMMVLLQFSGVWLRYLPFAKTVTVVQRRKLVQLAVSWGILAFAIYAAIMSMDDGEVLRFKLLVAFGWVPFFLISYYCIP